MIGFVNGLAMIIALSQVKSFKVDEDDDDDDDNDSASLPLRRRLLAGGFEVFYDDEVWRQLRRENASSFSFYFFPSSSPATGHGDGDGDDDDNCCCRCRSGLARKKGF